jgi:hypothetical protein
VLGCSTARVVYPGGRRSAGEVATIHSKDTVLEEIDGVPLRALSFEAFEVLPGPHVLRVRLQVSSDVPFTPGRYYSEGGLFVCFTARPGRAYTVVPAFDGGDRWKPEIVDRATTYRISVRYAMPGTSECLGERPKRPDVPVAPPDAPPAEGLAAEPSVPGQVQEQEAPPPPRLPAASSGRASQVVAGAGPPAMGLGLETGFFFGGADLVLAERANGDREKLTAGGGVLVALGLLATPLRLENSGGLGFGLNAGWKGASIAGSNGRITFWRLPMNATVHAFIPVGERSFFLPRAGLFGDFGARLSGEGIAANISGRLSTGLGAQLEAALYWSGGAHNGVSVGLRYSMLDYSIGGSTVDGNSLGLAISVYYNP